MINPNLLIDPKKPVTICRASAGTGKTYTLAAYYVGLLLSGEDYRSILAITFTNKATAEMSERIIGFLHGIGQGGEKDFLAYARQFMIRDHNAPDSVLEQRASTCFRQMLQDYDNVRIMTIDSFLMTLLSGLAGVLKMSVGMNTELDIDHVIRQAVDQLITTDMTPSDRSILENYMQLKLDQENHSDVRESLCAMAKEMYTESVQVLDAREEVLFDSSSIARRRELVKKLWEQYPRVQELKALLDQCNPAEYNKNTKYAYDRLVKSVQNPDKIASADRFRGAGTTCNAEEIARATALADEVRRYYNTLQLTIRYSCDMELMGSLQALIRRNLAQTNSALLARTAGTLTKALKGGDADFILEKAGIRYHHVLIDEFQDTSQLQWSVIYQLLKDLVACTGNTLLVVGDIKQSIYRWRNGDWHIMEELPKDPLVEGRLNTNLTSLTRNFRSSEEVVRFNLSLFRYITAQTDNVQVKDIYNEGYYPEKLESFYQANKKKGGYVSFKAIPKAKNEDLAANMFDAMEQMLQRGMDPSQMMVLVREKKEASLITDLHARLDGSQYPRLSAAHIVSADSFMLDKSAAVKTIIAALRYILHHDDVSATYLAQATSDIEAPQRACEAVNPSTPLYEAVCELIRVLLTDGNGQYQGTETAYINNLLDRTRAYVSTYGGGWNDFLVYWDDTMHEKAIPTSAVEAIRIMTVHASKGLQSQTLFVPFCAWPKEAGRHLPKVWCRVADEVGGNDAVPIQYGSEMEQSEYAEEYDKERKNMYIDNMNMLYVALTRAEDNLFISTNYSVNKDGKMGVCSHVGKYIMDYVQGEGLVPSDLAVTEPMVYEAGIPVVKPVKKEEQQTTIIAELWANSDQVRFVQSQEGALYTGYGDDAYQRVARMDEGILCHDIFAHLRKADELDQVLDTFESRGEIRDKVQREELRALIASAWKGNEQMRDWFTAPWELRLELPIYHNGREMRPDRVMINPETNAAIVLDYKFGQWEDEYNQQVQDYMEALRAIGYSHVRGFLWFARKKQGKQLVEIKYE